MTDATQQNIDHPQAPRHNEPPKVIYTTHPKVVVSVVLMASLMLFSALFSAILVIPEFITDKDDLLIAAILAGILTLAFWLIFGAGKKG